MLIQFLKTFSDRGAFPDMHRTRVVKADTRDSALEFCYFEILTAACVDLVRADGRLDENEVDFLRHVLHLTPKQARKLANTKGFTHYRRILRYLTPGQKQELLDLLLECADDQACFNPPEIRFLEGIVDRLELPEEARRRALKRIRC